MFRHVCRQNNSNETLSESLKIVTREVLQKVVLGLVEDGKTLSCVEVLLHRLVTVAYGSLRDEVDVVGIGVAIVAKIMANCCHTNRKGIQLTHLGEVEDVAFREEKVAHLEDIHGVHVVVVLDVPSVALVDLADKPR